MSRFLDERGRFFGKVNVVDVVVVLVIAAVVVFAVVRATDRGSTTVPVKTTYTVVGVRKATVDALQIGGSVTDDGGTALGEVVSVSVRPSLEEYMTPQGELKAFESPIFNDVEVVVQGNGTLSGSTLRIGDIPMRVGKRVTLVGVGFEVQSTIMRVLWGEEALK